jgi:hypothetical protein
MTKEAIGATCGEATGEAEETESWERTGGDSGGVRAEQRIRLVDGI